jgi:C-terminal processing protease CtpA/Prc
VTPGSHWAATAAACIATLIAACGGSGGSTTSGDACSAANQKNFVLDAARQWYLFQELLPASVNIDDFPTPGLLLDELTSNARADGKDRFFSYVTTPEADDSLLLEGQYIGFGFRTSLLNDRLFVPDVYEGSPAGLAGLARGAEITHIDSGSGFVPIGTILAADPELEEAFGPVTEGVERGLRFVTTGGLPAESVVTKQVVTIPPVPLDGTAILSMPSNTAVPVGYINLRTFVSTAETPLRDAYAQFRLQGIQYFIVDLRYNGGGLVRIAELFGDLHGRARNGDDVLTRTRFNASKSSNDSVRRFNPRSQSVEPVRIAFITTGGTASASEIVINSQDPWVEVAIIGADTFGKPVGQSAFDLGGCDLRLRLVSFETRNADDEGDYYDGLAAMVPFACAADDDLARAPWDSTEASTAAALYWLENGACRQVMSSAGLAAQKDRAGFRMPQLRRPSAAQAWLPGLY